MNTDLLETKDKKHCKPAWLKRTLPTGPDYESVRKLLRENNLNTVCQEAKCPNMWECFSRNTATFMIMGSLNLGNIEISMLVYAQMIRNGAGTKLEKDRQV